MQNRTFICLPSRTSLRMVAWGAFYFRTTSRGKWKIIDDDDLKYIHPPRKDSIGAQSAPYGPARVEVYDKAGALVSVAKTEVANHCWLPGLKPDTEYTYKVFVKDEEWAVGERWDWSAKDKALVQAGNRYDNRFCTNPDPTLPAASLSFAVMGDFGIGVKRTHRPGGSRRSRTPCARRSIQPMCGSSSRPATTSMRAYACSAFPSAEPATKTMTGSSPTFSRIDTSSIACRYFRRSGTTTRTRPKSATTGRRSRTTSIFESA